MYVQKLNLYLLLCFKFNCRCQDYVIIDAGTSSMEYCGNVVPPNPFIVGTGILSKCIVIIILNIVEIYSCVIQCRDVHSEVSVKFF